MFHDVAFTATLRNLSYGRVAKEHTETSRNIFLLIPVRYSSFCQVIRGQLYLHFIARQYPDKMHAHLSGDMSKDHLPAFYLYPEHRVRQSFLYLSIDFYQVFFRHRYSVVKITAPSLVKATVCSKCADMVRSVVTAVHPSSNTVTSSLPSLTIGSIAKTIPSWSTGPS